MNYEAWSDIVAKTPRRPYTSLEHVLTPLSSTSLHLSRLQDSRRRRDRDGTFRAPINPPESTPSTRLYRANNNTSKTAFYASPMRSDTFLHQEWCILGPLWLGADVGAARPPRGSQERYRIYVLASALSHCPVRCQGELGLLRALSWI